MNNDKKKVSQCTHCQVQTKEQENETGLRWTLNKLSEEFTHGMLLPLLDLESLINLGSVNKWFFEEVNHKKPMSHINFAELSGKSAYKLFQNWNLFHNATSLAMPLQDFVYVNKNLSKRKSKELKNRLVCISKTFFKIHHAYPIFFCFKCFIPFISLWIVS